MTRDVWTIILRTLVVAILCGCHSTNPCGIQDRSPGITEISGSEARLPPVMIGVCMARTSPAMASQLRHLGVVPEGTTLLTMVADDTPASRSGLRQWDLILGVNGGGHGPPVVIRGMLSQAAPGDRIVFDVLRDGRTFEVEVELVEPDPARMLPRSDH